MMTNRRRSFFTLIALCVAAALILWLESRSKRPEISEPELGLLRHRQITSDIDTLQSRLERFHVLNGRYPTTEEGLAALHSGIKDPWQHEYIYRRPSAFNRGPYDLFSAGPDGKADTVDDDYAH